MTTTSLKNEIDRQREYLDQLPSDYDWPVFNTKVALESMRKSGYRSTGQAAREIVDNAIEAGASRIDVVIRQTKPASTNRNTVTAVAFIDNGSGMLPNMARFALTWGGGTHFDDSQFIGKFGFGLPNASINQTRYVDVYTRISAGEPFSKTYLDLDLYGDYGVQSVPAPEQADLPEWVCGYLEREERSDDARTVVIWRNPDMLTYKSPGRLKEHLVDDFGAVYRYLLMREDAPLKIIVQGVDVQPTDPLFLTPGALLYESPNPDVESLRGGGARQIEDWFIPVKYIEDGESGERRLERVESLSDEDIRNHALLALGTIYVRMARFPVGFALGEKVHRGTDAYRRFEIRKTRRGMSFVRSGREIEIYDAFPKTARDKADGLGDWPLLQSYAYHCAVEVKFGPALDVVFGITNDKQSVRPVEDFWRVLTEEGIDAACRRENLWQVQARQKLETAEPPEKDDDEPSPAEAAVQDADVASSETPAVPAIRRDEAKKRLDEEIGRKSKVTGESAEEIRKSIEEAAKKKKYEVDFFRRPDGPFYEPEWIGSVIRVRINTEHPFYKVLYQRLLKLSGGLGAKEAVDVLLLSLARAELTANETDVIEWYETQRKRRWSPFLEDALKRLEKRLEPMFGPEDAALIEEGAAADVA